MAARVLIVPVSRNGADTGIMSKAGLDLSNPPRPVIDSTGTGTVSTGTEAAGPTSPNTSDRLTLWPCKIERASSVSINDSLKRKGGTTRPCMSVLLSWPSTRCSIEWDGRQRPLVVVGEGGGAG